MKKDTNAKVTDRREGIVKLINERGYAGIDFLAEHYEVSTQTIRRDILVLSKSNMFTRHHGGAGFLCWMKNENWPKIGRVHVN